MIISFFVGINEANRSWKMILLLLAANVLSSLPLIVPIFLLVFGASRGTIAADSLMADKLDAVWLMDVANYQFPGADRNRRLAGRRAVRRDGRLLSTAQHAIDRRRHRRIQFRGRIVHDAQVLGRSRSLFLEVLPADADFADLLWRRGRNLRAAAMAN